MTPEERELLRRSISLAEENNDILRSIRQSMRLARLMSLIYWMFIIGSAIGAYYYAQPYIQQFTGLYNSAQNDLSTFSSFLEKFKNIAPR